MDEFKESSILKTLTEAREDYQLKAASIERSMRDYGVYDYKSSYRHDVEDFGMLIKYLKELWGLINDNDIDT